MRQLLTPWMFGAQGHGADDSEAFDKMSVEMQALHADRKPVTVDLHGDWYVSRTVCVKGAANSEILGGRLTALPGGDFDPVLVLDMGNGSRKRGQLIVRGKVNVDGLTSSWLTHRTPGDGVHLERWNSCGDDGGWHVEGFQRHGIHTTGSVISGAVRDVVVDKCGSSPHGPAVTLSQTWCQEIVLLGRAGGNDQKCQLKLGEPLPALHEGAFVRVGVTSAMKIRDGACLLRVEMISEDGLTVQCDDWPGGPEDGRSATSVTAGEPWEGAGTWLVTAYVGGAMSVHGGNTTQFQIYGLRAMRCGVGLRSGGLYGALTFGLMAEACGIGAVFGADGGRHMGARIYGFHPEQVGVPFVEATTNAVGSHVEGSVVELVDWRMEHRAGPLLALQKIAYKLGPRLGNRPTAFPMHTTFG